MIIPTFSEPGIPHAADMNFLLTVPQSSVWIQTAPGAYTTGVTTVVNWTNTLLAKDGTAWDGVNVSRLTANTAGTWLYIATIQWTSNATGMRWIELRRNSGGSAAGGVYVDQSVVAAVNGGGTQQQLVCFQQMNQGDYVELFATQTSGGGLAIIGGNVCRLAAFWMGQL